MSSIYAGVFLLSAATLAFEVTLTRLFSVAQWYHFAFMAVSVALLGFGASGSLLALIPERAKRRLEGKLPLLAGLFAISLVLGYLGINYVPFDSYRIAWDPKQLLYLALYYLALVLPFLVGGLVLGTLFAIRPGQAGSIYASNLAGSAAGCVMALAAPPLFDGTGTVLLSAALALLSALAFKRRLWHPPSLLATLALLLLALRPPGFLELRLSPYKGLSQALLYPEARIAFNGWNAFSRLDVVESKGIKSAPGLSLAFQGPLPPQLGLFIDGDEAPPIIQREADLSFIDYLPTSLPFLLRPGARVLAIHPRGGLDVLVALERGASSVTVVEDNPLVVEVVKERFGPWAGHIYKDERVRVTVEGGRSYVRRSQEEFDLILLSPTGTFRAVLSGAYSLSEDYLYTIEAFEDYYRRLAPEGLLVVSRWLQLPPSEEVRAGALAVTALERAGVRHPERSLAVLRSWSTALLLVKKGELTEEEIALIKDFCTRRSFDLVYYPGMREEEANRYNVLNEPVYFRAFQELLGPQRRRLYAQHPFDISPPTDDRPFFFHFFKWSQVPTILANLGKIWQPFGGSGYLVLIALLVLAFLASGALILLPLLLRRPSLGRRRGYELRLAFAYFSFLGFGYLLAEIPLIQRFILFLGHPSYAFAVVVASLLGFSGLGSMASPRLPWRKVLLILWPVVLVYPYVLSGVFRLFLGSSLAWRFLVAWLSLAPLGFLMGIPFPKGMAELGRVAPDLVPWAWGVNGCASVLASILAAMMAISWGFSRVLLAGALAYLGSLLVVARAPGRFNKPEERPGP